MAKKVARGVTRTSPIGSKPYHTFQSSKRRSSFCGGFTTIELMVVLVIIAVMSTVVIISMEPVLRDAKSRSACRVIASALTYARSYAIANRIHTRVVFHTDRNGCSVETFSIGQNGESQTRPLTTQSGRFRHMPEGIQISYISKPGIDVQERWISFTELGQAEDAEITVVDSEGNERIVSVDGLTGRCKIIKSNGDAEPHNEVNRE